MSDQQVTRIGVVGAGVMGARHARVFSETPGAQLVGVFDPDTMRASEVAGQYGGLAYSTLESLLEQVDAISIASLTSTHAGISLQAIDANLHVMIEKPIAGTMADARRIVEAGRKRPDLTIMVGHIERFNPAAITLRSALEGQEIQSVTTRRTSPPGTRALDTDVVHDLMIHDIDLAMDILGDDVASVDAEGSIIYSGFIDSAVAQFEMDSQRRATMIASRAARRKAREIIVTTDRGRFVADLLGKSVTFLPHDEPATIETFPVSEEEPLAIELHHFLDCLQTNTRPLVDAECGHRAMIYAESICNLIQRSASRYPVSFSPSLARTAGAQ